MDTSLDGSSPNAPLSSTPSTASLTSNTPTTVSSTSGSHSVSQSAPSSTASHPVGSSHGSSSAAASHPPSVRSAGAKQDAISSSSSTSNADSPPAKPQAPSNSPASNTPTSTSKPMVSATDAPVSHTPQPTSPRPHPPDVTSTHASASPTKKPSPPPPATSKPANTPPAPTSAPHSSQVKVSEAQASQKTSASSVGSAKESAATSSGTSANSTKPLNASNSTTSGLTSSQARPTSSGSSVKNVSPNALVTDFSTFTSETGIPFLSTSAETASPTGFLTANSSSGFFANRGAVAGVFAVVGLAVLGLLGFFIFTLFRRCRRHDGYVEEREPSLPNLDADPYEVEPHYRRMSQVIAFGNVLSAGAAGVGAGSRRRPRSYVGSDGSHARSNETYHSADPIIHPEKNPFSNFHAAPSPVPEDSGVPPYPHPAYPFRSASRFSQQSAAESSPSIYPPSLPLANDDEEYWRHRERGPTPGLSEDTTEERNVFRQQPTPPYSSLGLWTNVSQPTMTPQNTSENDVGKGIDPRMEPSSLHRGSTAPIAPARAHLHDPEGRHVLDGTWTVPNRGGTALY